MKKKIRYCGLLLGVVLSLSACGKSASAQGLITYSEARTEASDTDTAETAQSEDVIYVYICGAVENPGVYALEAGSRIYQLVEEAGGLTEKASKTSVNLAQTLSDGEMVEIPKKGSETSETSSSESTATDSSLVNINTADADALMTLSGIGEVKAAAIIQYREENGSFSSIEDIMNVSGIAEGTYAKLKDSICV